MYKSLIVLSVLLAAAAADPSRIVGGETAADGQFPFMASLRRNGRHSCGGAILTDEWILTAAQCLIGVQGKLTIVTGTNSLSEGGQEYDFYQQIKNTGFSFDKMHNDIALVRTNSKIQFNDKVQPIEWNTEKFNEDVELTMIGWGSKNNSEEPSDSLQYATLKTISTEQCNNMYFNTGRDIDNTQICTLTHAGQGACFGDGGTPLIYKGKVAGVASWGTPCAVGKPDVFTRVTEYIQWIHWQTGL